MSRIKGQEVEVLLIVNSAPQANIVTIQNFSIQYETEMLSEGYLGETTERKDTIFKGISGKLDMHFDNQDILSFFTTVIDRARKRTPGVQINIKATLNFDNGQRPRVLIPACEFGPMPLEFASRSDYGKVSLDFGASEATTLF